MDREEANVHENVSLDVKPNVRQLGLVWGNIVIPHRDSGHLSNGEMTDIAESEF